MAMGEQPADKEVEEAGGGGKKEEAPAPASPSAAIILAVELHCTGCAKRIKRCILRCRGVEGVEVDMGGNQVTVKVKGMVDPQALCARLHKKTMRKATVVSPPEPADKPEPPPETRKMELRVNMHCQPCADLLLKNILKMPGVETAEADLSAGMLTVTGTMTADKIVEYLHRRTGKLATVLPPPDPPKPEEQPQAAAGETKPPEDEGQKKEDKPAPAAEADKKPAEEAADKGKEKQEEGVAVVDGFPPEEMMKRLAYWPYAAAGHKQYPATAEEVMMARRMATMNLMPQPAMMPQWTPPPPPPPPPVYYSSSYMVERPAPAMQLFSDENPNACVIS